MMLSLLLRVTLFGVLVALVFTSSSSRDAATSTTPAIGSAFGFCTKSLLHSAGQPGLAGGQPFNNNNNNNHYATTRA